MKTFSFRYWYKYAYEQDDFDFVDIVAENEELARLEVRKIRRWINKIELIETK